MRKLISFLALLVIAFALPGKALAWNYNSNQDPKGIYIDVTSGNVNDFTLQFDSEQKLWWAEFTANEGWINFKVRSIWGNNDQYNVYGKNCGSSTPGTWVNEDAADNGESFYYSGLTKNARYRFELKGKDGDPNKFQFRVVLAGATSRGKLYLYDTSGPTKIGEATEDNNGNYTFNVTLESNKNFVLSKNNNATTWAGIQNNSGRFNPNSDVDVPAEDTAFGNYNSGSWHTTEAGDYTITVNWGAQTLTATCGQAEVDYPSTIYLYYTNGANSSPERFAAASKGADGLYTFNLDKIAGNFVVGTIGDADGNWNKLNTARYNPATQDEFAITEEFTGMVAGTDGAWTVPAGSGPYTVVIDWAGKQIKAIFRGTVNINLPLTSADFKNVDGTARKHYFIVGERMGEWHLQPEWELTRANGQLELNNRVFYDGYFAVAVVDNYADYTKHKYKYYANDGDKDYGFNSENLKSAISATAYNWNNKKGETWYNPGTRKFNSTFDGDYSYGKGKYIKKIIVTLDDNGTPSSLELVPGTEAEDAKNRLFTLVGSNIYNDQYCNTTGGGTTTMYSRGYYTGDGWQEGWIQFDPSDSKPYIDGNGEYLYHTSFTPDYLLANPVYFNQPLGEGENFSFLSTQTQFVEYTKLPNLDEDPYKDFYQAFGGKEKIATGSTKAGENYAFKVKLVNDEEGLEPTSNWSCYVVRDMWIGGEIKFWAGWGGNSNHAHGDTNTGAAWHGENGGPAIAKGGRQDVKGSDINVSTETEVELYRNGRQIDDANYVISEDGTPVYFNRVVLWYNPVDGVANSYIQFVQESASPAIFARVTDNADKTKKNFIRYNWYISNSQITGDEDKVVTAYEIRRYKVVDGVASFIGYPEGGKKNITETVTVKDLYEGNADNYSFTKYTDSGTVAGKGFAPGLYQYDIYVYFEDGTKKKAVSNTVAIYDNSLVSPMAVALQVVELRDAYTGVSGEEIPSGVKYFGESNTRRYLTYSPDDNAPYFLFDEKEVEVEGVDGKVTTIIPDNPRKVDSAIASEFLENHPEMYMWTSNYYVRCLDYKQYANTMQSWIDNGVMNETEVPYPVLTVTEYVDITDEDGNLARTEEKMRGYAHYFEFPDDNNEHSNKEYFAMLVKRGGNLADGNFEVNLNVEYKDAESNTHTISTSEATGFDPVIPRPYKPLYRYTYIHPENQTFDKKWGRILVPSNNWKGHATTTDHLVYGDTAHVFVDLEHEFFNPRQLILQLEFTRPNVADEIYSYYDIHYQLKFNSNNEEEIPTDLDFVLHDEATADVDKDGKPDHIPNRYRLEFYGIHPRNAVWPVISLVNTEYHPRVEKNPETGYTFVDQPANYGEDYTIEAKSTIVTTTDGKLNNVHLGVIRRADGTYDWMYKGHEELVDSPDKVDPFDEEFEYEDPSSENIYDLHSQWYLFEFKAGDDEYTYDYLVPHVEGHADGQKVDPITGLMDNDSDPLIGTYVAKGFKTDEVPTVYATAMYVFNRDMTPSGDNSGIKFGDLSIVESSIPLPEDETAAPARERRKLPSNNELMHGNAGGMPDAGVLPAEGEFKDLSADENGTGYNDFISLKGATYSNTPGDDTVTAVEVIVFEGVEGEVRYYDLKGILLPEEPTTPGVYVRADGENITKFVVQ
ncbi:MAG: hypothetical protein HDS69_00690 [Bacteroidales bacterium]|nr:hypothetical protein [Bacteroidales bacterium]